MASELPVDKTIAITIDGEEGKPALQKKKKRRHKRKKEGFLRKTEDSFEFSFRSHEAAAKSREGFEIVDNRVKWVKAITSSSVKALWKEFQANRNYKPASFTTHAYDQNEQKNRYNDILCIDATRVKLKARRDYDDYIHANWIIMPDNQKYICTQGPIAESVEDFWHMVFTEKSNVVVMLCGFVEGNHEKCRPYFSNELSVPVSYGNIYTVTVRKCYERDPTGTIIHRLLEVDALGTTTYVHHFAHTTWPDHTAPSSSLATVALLKLARITSSGNPIVVHCSAGIGRTATFVGIDYAVQRINQDANTSMVDVLKSLRDQRLHAIQSPIQYVFLHLCIVEVFIEDGVINNEGRVRKFFDMYTHMLTKYLSTYKKR
ncbi:hypothetical protein Q1695_006589 [Nippostrongylus brasiliensis]|nr:hypothetical protein Q1695_006589 [Nippostrongylus brasiliensis]